MHNEILILYKKLKGSNKISYILSNSKRKDAVPLTANVLFSGIGAQEKGFINSGCFDFKVTSTSDISKEAVLAYAAIHYGLTEEMITNYENYPPKDEMVQYLTDLKLGFEPEKNKEYNWNKYKNRKNFFIERYWLACKLSNNLGDISKIKQLPYADLWTISFCCQDISVAGKMKGLSPDSGTRSSLLWENIRLLKDSKERNELPKYLMFENVKNLVSKKFIDDFNNLIEVLDEVGFNTYWKVLNAKNCGIPQNRERVFAVSIRKDIDTGKFEFPKEFNSGLRLKDLLEEDIDEKFFLSDKIQNRLQITDESFTKNIIGTTKPECRTIGQRDLVYQTDSIMGSLVATDYKQPKQILVDTNTVRKIGDAYSNPNKIGGNGRGNIYDTDGICATITTMSGGGNHPMIVDKDTNHCVQSGTFEGGRWDKIYESARRYYSTEGISPTVTTCGGGNTEPKVEVANKRVRKLTPTECYKLMGFSLDDIHKVINIGMSSSARYKQAGNSIVTNCVELLAEHLYKAQYDNTYKCIDENFKQPPIKASQN